jgi:hypothetical protein
MMKNCSCTSLSERTLGWYIRLDNMKIQKWKDLINAFFKHYRYNMDVIPDKSSLQNMKIGDRGFIREYT